MAYCLCGFAFVPPVFVCVVIKCSRTCCLWFIVCRCVFSFVCACVLACVCACVPVFWHVFVCCVCDLRCDAEWCFCVFRVCVNACVYCVCVLFVLYGVMLDGLCFVFCLRFVFVCVVVV